MATATARSRVPNWLAGLIPLLIVGILVAVFLALDPIARLREIPPVEAIAVERTVLDEGSIELHLRNDGPDDVTVAQVLVNDAYTYHEISNRTLGRLETERLTISYPWEEAIPLNIALVTSTGLTIEHEIEAPALTPDVDAKTIGIYALLGLYIGVIPVAIGLLWFPSLRRASKRWVTFFLAFTVGLLAFLLVDTVGEGFELVAETAGALDGLGLFAIGALVAVFGLTAFEGAMKSKGRKASTGLVVAYLIAAGIGLHNLGEGLAVGSALAAGEVALGTFLVVGFALHNTTEGLAIVAPMGGEAERPSLKHFVALGAIAGLPTIAGAWIGGFIFSPAFAAVAFGIAAGAIGQVIWTISKSMSGRGLTSGFGALGFITGLVVMYATGLLTV